jgi:hypothetical protein
MAMGDETAVTTCHERLLDRPLRQPSMSRKTSAITIRSTWTYIGLLRASARGNIDRFAWEFVENVSFA